MVAQSIARGTSRSQAANTFSGRRNMSVASPRMPRRVSPRMSKGATVMPPRKGGKPAAWILATAGATTRVHSSTSRAASPSALKLSIISGDAHPAMWPDTLANVVKSRKLESLEKPAKAPAVRGRYVRSR